MKHELDYIYRGHEVVIIDARRDGEGWICDIRDGLDDEEFLRGFNELDSKREAEVGRRGYEFTETPTVPVWSKPIKGDRRTENARVE